MLFTHFGVSGPIILTLSGTIVDALPAGKIELSLDLKPALTQEKVEDRLTRHKLRIFLPIVPGYSPCSQDLARLITLADQALYLAKARGPEPSPMKFKIAPRPKGDSALAR